MTKTKRLHRMLGASVCLLALCLPALASTYRLLELPEILAAAEIAVRGTVRSSDSVLVDGEPWTRVTIEVATLLVDSEEPRVQDDLLILDFLGGSAGGIQLSVALMPQFTAGDELLLLAYDAPYYSPVVGFNQGLWMLSGSGEWLDSGGRTLGLTEDGELQRGATGSADETVAELRRLLEDR